jgi:predicted ABC-type ATPase
MPTLYIVAGPNGVGKTTFATRYLPEEARQLEFVNADLIARGVSPFDPDRNAVVAGRIALGRIRELVRARVGFTWETTLSGLSARVWLREAKTQGYLLKCYFLWVRNPETSLARIRQRVLEGGHDIPPGIVQRRFHKSIRNFLTSYRHLMDTWKLYANVDREPRLIAVRKEGRMTVRDPRFLASVLTELRIDL